MGRMGLDEGVLIVVAVISCAGMLPLLMAKIEDSLGERPVQERARRVTR